MQLLDQYSVQINTLAYLLGALVVRSSGLNAQLERPVYYPILTRNDKR